MRAKRGRPETAEAPNSHIPLISQKTKRLADKQRSKYGAEETGKKTAIAVVEHMLQKEKVRAAMKQQKIEEIKLKQQDDDG